MRYVILTALALGAVQAQDSLTVAQAVELALTRNPAVEASRASAKAAETRVTQAGGARLPRIQYTESWQRSNNPVFVFGSLLSQHQFGLENFNLPYLNRPPFLNNFQSLVTLDQSIWDNGYRSSQIKAASAGALASREEERRVQMQTIAGVVRAYYGALLAQESLNVAREALKSAEADLNRAQNRRQAGFTTDADVLSIRVHVATMQERRIRGEADVEAARAALNQAIGLPLDTKYDLTTTLKPATPAADALESLERDAQSMRPEARQAGLAHQAAEAQQKAARSALLPEVFLRASFEADRQDFYRQGGANWLASAGLRWTIFSGFTDRARVQEAAHALAGVQAQQRYVESGVRLETRRAWLDLRAARERIEVTQAAVGMAEENLRIVKNRYDAGLADVTELLRSETALLESRTRNLTAIQDQRLAVMQVELAAGRLNEKSQVVTE